MTFNAANLFLVHLMPETRLEFSMGGSSNQHRGQATTEKDLHTVGPKDYKCEEEEKGAHMVASMLVRRCLVEFLSRRS
jgi:hypothetical protein